MPNKTPRLLILLLALLAAPACSGDDTVDGGTAAGDTATAESVQPSAEAGPQRAALPGLFAIMLELQGDMERVSRGLWTASFDTIAVGARAIAEHPKIPPEELAAVAEALGPDLPRFKELDTRVHDLSVELAEAARAGDMARVLDRDAALRQGCVECHTTFRERLRSEVPNAAADEAALQELSQDVLPTSAGDLTATFVGHGTLAFRLGDRVIHVDPVSREADYAAMPDADVILVTHDHGDHLDPDAIAAIRTPDTEIVVSPSSAGRIEGATVMENGETRTVGGFVVDAVPAYNLEHVRENGQPYHPKGAGNGYVIRFGDTRVYVAGDTENTPEMKALEGIDVAFLPMNLPYTMTPAMVANAARSFRPGILYPYHYGDTDPAELVGRLEGEGIEVRVRPMR